MSKDLIQLESLNHQREIEALKNMKTIPILNQERISKIQLQPLPSSLYTDVENARISQEISKEMRKQPELSLNKIQKALLVKRGNAENLFLPNELDQIQNILSNPDLKNEEKIDKLKELTFFTSKVKQRSDEDDLTYLQRITDLLRLSTDKDLIIKSQINAEITKLRQNLSSLMDDVAVENVLNNPIFTDEKKMVLNQSFDAFVKDLESKYETLNIPGFINALSFWFDKVYKEPKIITKSVDVKKEDEKKIEEQNVEEEKNVSSSKPYLYVNKIEINNKQYSLYFYPDSLEVEVDNKLWDKKADIDNIKKLIGPDWNKNKLKDYAKRGNAYDENGKIITSSLSSSSSMKKGRGIINWSPFGKYSINLDGLNSDKLQLRYINKNNTITGMPDTIISNDGSNFLKDLIHYKRFNDKLFKKLQPYEQTKLQNIISRSGLKQQLGLDTDTDNDKEMLNRYLVLMGMSQGGNDAPSVKKELRAIISHFIKTGKMSKTEGLLHLNELL